MLHSLVKLLYIMSSSCKWSGRLFKTSRTSDQFWLDHCFSRTRRWMLFEAALSKDIMLSCSET